MIKAHFPYLKRDVFLLGDFSVLLIKDVETEDIFPLYIVDAHHHVGREQSIANRPSDVYMFFARIENYILSKFKKMSPSELSTYRFIPLNAKPSLAFFSDILAKVPSWQDVGKGWMIDKAVVFPMNDIYAYTTNIAFEKSNKIISNITTKLPDSLRLYGFARVDPHDGKNAVIEFRKSIVERGLRGLKLHPISQMFVDNLLGSEVISLVKEAAYFNVPVIIDARFIATARRIKQLGALVYEELRNEGKNTQTPRLIVAHCGRSFSNSDLFHEVLSSRLIFGETSTISGDDIPIFYDLASEILTNQKIENSWSSKIIFGTDSPFMGEIQAIEHILYLMSYDFYSKTGGSFYEIQQILGGNILRILGYPLTLPRSSNLDETTCCDSYIVKDSNVFEEFLKTLLKVVVESKVTILSIDNFIAPYGTFVYNDKFLVTIKKNTTNEVFGILFYIDYSHNLYSVTIIKSFTSGFAKLADFKKNSLYKVLSKSIETDSLNKIEEFLT